MNVRAFSLAITGKDCKYSTLYFKVSSFYNTQNLRKTYSPKSKGDKYFPGKYLNTYEAYLRQYGLMQQKYISANNHEQGVTMRNL